MKVLILGLGGIGTMAAWRLAQAGHEVVGFEQFDLDHDRGSSFGDSRIIRRVYSDPLYTGLMTHAYPLWDEFQAAFPTEELIRLSGGIFFGHADDPSMTQARESLEQSGNVYEVLDASATRKRWKGLHLSSDEVAIYEPSMGYLRASRCVRAAATLARQLGATLYPNSTIEAIEATANGIRIVTHQGIVETGDSLVVTAGPWIGQVLGRLGVTVPTKVTRQTYIHLAEENVSHNAISRVASEPIPVWIDATSLHYGFPPIGDLPGAKIARHIPGVETTPETVARDVTDGEIADLTRYARNRFDGLSDRVVYSKVCLYTNTPTEDFIVDAVPGLPRAYMVGGLSGHGFKFAPLLGEILAQLAVNGETRYPLDRFRLSAFAQPS